jgi:hypothetical protein
MIIGFCFINIFFQSCILDSQRQPGIPKGKYYSTHSFGFISTIEFKSDSVIFSINFPETPCVNTFSSGRFLVKQDSLCIFEMTGYHHEKCDTLKWISQPIENSCAQVRFPSDTSLGLFHPQNISVKSDAYWEYYIKTNTH